MYVTDAAERRFVENLPDDRGVKVEKMGDRGGAVAEIEEPPTVKNGKRFPAPGVQVPISRAEAERVDNPEAPFWDGARGKEIGGMTGRGEGAHICFETVDADGKEWTWASVNDVGHFVGCHFVYCIKADGTFKARLVIRGNEQDPSTYGATTSSTVSAASNNIIHA